MAETPDQILDLAFGYWGDLGSLAGLRAKLRKQGKPIAAVRRTTYCPQCRSHLPHYLAPLVRHKKRARKRQQPNLFYSRYALSKKFWRKEFWQDDVQFNSGTIVSHDSLTRYFWLNKIRKLATVAG